jgi:hypothetical protein
MVQVKYGEITASTEESVCRSGNMILDRHQWIWSTLFANVFLCKSVTLGGKVSTGRCATAYHHAFGAFGSGACKIPHFKWLRRCASKKNLSIELYRSRLLLSSMLCASLRTGLQADANAEQKSTDWAIVNCLTFSIPSSIPRLIQRPVATRPLVTFKIPNLLWFDSSLSPISCVFKEASKLARPTTTCHAMA